VKEIKIGVASSDLQRPRIVQKESITVKEQEKVSIDAVK